MTKIELKEKEVQELIADFPWLLNIDYEIIPSLKNKGMEYRLSHGKRADLILKDRRSGRPVIVEFKAVPFYRENIGQILEYRARILSEIHDESSMLNEVFENKLFSPILLLVVPSCSAEAKLACNLAGIEIYEYESEITELTKPEKRRTLEEFKNIIDTDELPFDEDRSDFVEGVYSEIYTVLDELLDKTDLKDTWKNYTKPRGEYYEPLNNLFINKYLFPKNEVGIGIYEDVFSDSVSEKILIEFFSDDEDSLRKFKEFYIINEHKPVINSEITNDTYWTLELDKQKFLEDVKTTLNPLIESYLKVISQMESEDE